MKERSNIKREFIPLMKVYIVKALTMIGRKIECEVCGITEGLTFQHRKYYTHTIHDIHLLCWKHHMLEDFGEERDTPECWVGVYVDGANYAHSRGMKFKLSDNQLSDCPKV